MASGDRLAVERLTDSSEPPSGAGRAMLVEDDFGKDALGASARVGLGLQRSFSRSSRRRSISDSGKAGSRIISASSASAGANRERGTSSVAVSASHDASAWSRAPAVLRPR
jgi:hypothetical protein